MGFIPAVAKLFQLPFRKSQEQKEEVKEKMILKLTHTGFRPDQDGNNRSAVIETDSAEVRLPVEWLKTKLGLSEPAPSPYTISSPGVAEIGVLPSMLQGFNFVFTGPDGRSFGADILDVIYSTNAVAVKLIEQLGLKIDANSIGPYAPPAPPRQKADWEDPGAPIGPELPGKKGYFQNLGLASFKGVKDWTAASGTSYRLETFSVLGPLTMDAWKRL